MAARRPHPASWWNWRPMLPRRLWRSTERAELRGQLLGRGEAVVEGIDPTVTGQESRGWRGQHLERVRGRRLARELDPQDAKRRAVGRLDRLDRRILRGPADRATRSRKDDQGRTAIGQGAKCRPQTLCLHGPQAGQPAAQPPAGEDRGRGYGDYDDCQDERSLDHL